MGVDLYISNHINAGGGEGAEVYCSIYGGKGRTYAEAVSVGLSSIFSANRGVKTKQGDHGDYYHVIRETQMPAILIEHGFIDNSVDAQILKSDANLREMVRLTVEAIKRVAPSEATADQYTRNLSLKSPLMYGEDVKRVQKRLNALGFDAGSADGYFGENTKNAVIEFQIKNGLTADGIVGVQTWNKLFDPSANSNELTDEEILDIVGRTGFFIDNVVEFTGFEKEKILVYDPPITLSAMVSKKPTLSTKDAKFQLSAEGINEAGVTITDGLIEAGININFSKNDIIHALQSISVGFSPNEYLTYKIEVGSKTTRVIFETIATIGGKNIYTSLIMGIDSQDFDTTTSNTIIIDPSIEEVSRNLNILIIGVTLGVTLIQYIVNLRLRLN